MPTHVLLFAAFILILFFGAGWLAYSSLSALISRVARDARQRMDTHRKWLDQNETAVASLRTDHADRQERISALVGRINHNAEHIGELAGDVTQLDTQVEDMTERVEGNEEHLSELHGTVGEGLEHIRDRLRNLGETIDAVSGGTAVNSGRVNKLWDGLNKFVQEHIFLERQIRGLLREWRRLLNEEWKRDTVSPAVQEKRNALKEEIEGVLPHLGRLPWSPGENGQVGKTAEDVLEPVTIEETITREDIEHLGDDVFRTYRKTVPLQALRVEGPFAVKTREGVLECEDGYLGVDSDGYPYPIAKEEFEASYEPV